MIYSGDREKSILELFELKDEGEGILFADKDEAGKSTWRDDVKIEIDRSESFDASTRYHLAIMIDKGFIHVTTQQIL